MRAVVSMLVVCAVVGAAGLGWHRGGAVDAEAPGAKANDVSGASADDVAAEEGAGVPESLSSEDAGRMHESKELDASIGSTFYQWVDERGSVHFVASLDEVPAAWRSRAGQIELDPAVFTQTGPSASKGGRSAGAVQIAESAPVHEVTVYTAPWCGWCRKTLAFLDERGVDYVNKDIDADEGYAEELREKSGGTAIPFVEIDDSEIRGFDPGAMALLLD
jgi:glutaredoxin